MGSLPHPPPTTPTTGPGLTLLPTARLVRRRAAESPDPLRRYTTFPAFVDRAYAVLGDGRPWLSDLGRDRALRRLLAEHAAARPDGPLAPVLSKPGLTAALTEFLLELKRRGVQPDDIPAEVRTGVFGGVAGLYDAYRSAVRDGDDKIWSIAAALAGGAPLPVWLAGLRWVAVEDTDLLTPGQRALLEALVLAGMPLIYRWPLSRAVIDRLPLAAAQQRWLEDLSARRPQRVFVEVPSEQGTVDRAAAEPATFHFPLSTPPADLTRLRATLFGYDPPAASADGSVRLIQAPDAVAECDAIARDIRRRLREDPSLTPADVAVALGDHATYRPLLFERFARAGVPYFSRRGGNLTALPLFRFVRKVFGLPLEGFPGRAVVSVLQNSYSRFHHVAAIGEQKFTVDGPVVELLFAELNYAGADGETLARRFERRKVDFELQRGELRDRLAGGADAAEIRKLLDKVDADERREAAILAEIDRHFAPLRELAGIADARRLCNRALALLDHFAGSGRGAFAERDAKTRFLIRKVIERQRDEWPDGAAADYAGWLDEFDRLAARQALIDVGEPDGVQILTVQELSGFRYRLVYVPGLLHGTFPHGELIEPFLTPAIRAAVSARLTARGLPPMPAPDNNTEVDRLHFARCVNAAERELVLSVPVTAETMEDCPPGEFFADAEFLFRPDPDRPATLPRTVVPLREPVPALGDAATPADLHARTALELFEPAPVSESASAGEAVVPRLAPALYLHLSRTVPEDVLLWLRAAAVERTRLAALRDGGAVGHAFNGRFGAAAELLRDRFRHEASGDWLVRARELEIFGECPFRFLVECGLGLRALQRPDDEPDALARGRLIHRVLERFYRDPARREELPDLARHAPVLAQLAAEEMRQFRTGGLAGADDHVRTVAAQLQQRLDTFLEADGDFRRDAGTRPALLEHGLDAVPLPVEGLKLRVSGRIDRIDAAPDGSPVIVDYKNSAMEADPGRFRLGTLVQLGLYALALEADAPDKLAEAGVDARTGTPRGVYFALKRKRRTAVQPMPVFESPDWRTVMLSHLRRYVAALQSGTFPAWPVPDGCTFCPHSGICRTVEGASQRVGAGRADDVGEE